MASSFKGEFRTGLVYALGTFVGVSVLTWVWSQVQAFASPPKGHHGPAPMLAPVSVPSWVILLAAAVFVAFALFPSVHRWFYHDEKPEPTPRQSKNARETNSPLLIALLIALDDEKRKREQAERERDTAQQMNDHVLGVMRTGMQGIEKQRDDALRDALKWAPVTNLIVGYVRVVELVPVLEDARARMDARRPAREGSVTDVVLAAQQSAELNEKDFAGIRPRLIQVMTEVKAQHGLLNANLTEQKLTSYIRDSGAVREMIEGLNTLALILMRDIAEAAIKAVNYKSQQ